MKPFDLNKYIENPSQTLVLEHSQSPDECWVIRESAVVMGRKLAVTMPNTGYDTYDIEMVHNNRVRDKAHNFIGVIKVAEHGDLVLISIEDLSKIVMKMKIGGVINFNATGDTDHWGVLKTHLLDSTILVVGSYGGGSVRSHDLTIDSDQRDVLEFLTKSLRGKPHDFISYEVPIKTE